MYAHTNAYKHFIHDMQKWKQVNSMLTEKQSYNVILLSNKKEYVADTC